MSNQSKEDGLTTGGLTTGSLSDRPENSAIKQATPKEGLTTGSLSDRPQSAFDRNREKVAEQYAPALSGKEGALAQFDAVTELMRNQIEEYESGKIISSNGATSIQGFGQFLAIRSKKSQGQGSGTPEELGESDPGPWGLFPVPDDKFSVQVGTIYKDFGSVDESTILDITAFDLAFELSATTVIYLELAVEDPLVMTLKAGAAWTEYPLTFKQSTSGILRVEKAYFRLWHGVAGVKPANTIGESFDGFWMKKTCRSNDLVLAYGDHELEGGTRNIPVPILFPM